MPALPIPCDDGNASVLVNAGAVIVNERVFVNARYVRKENVHYLDRLTSDEFRECPWARTFRSLTMTSQRETGFEIIISTHGTDLKVNTRGIVIIFLDLTPFKLNDWLSPRIKWIAKYAEIKKRRTAVAMATHKRLGGASPLACLNKDTIQMVIAFASE